MLNAMIKGNRQSADLYVMRARLHQVANRITVAYYDVREALKLDPQHVVRRLWGMGFNAGTVLSCRQRFGNGQTGSRDRP